MKLIIPIAMALSGCSLMDPTNTDEDGAKWAFHSVWDAKTNVQTEGLISLQSDKEIGTTFEFLNNHELSLNSPCGSEILDYQREGNVITLLSIKMRSPRSCSGINAEGIDQLKNQINGGMRVVKNKNRTLLVGKEFVLMFKNVKSF